jgi:hypothetical protein
MCDMCDSYNAQDDSRGDTWTERIKMLQRYVAVSQADALRYERELAWARTEFRRRLRKGQITR